MNKQYIEKGVCSTGKYVSSKGKRMWVVKGKGYREYNKTMCYRDSSVSSIGISARSVQIV